MVQIHVPSDMGGTLRQLPEDTYEAAIQDMFLGTAKSSGNPKITLKWVIQSEYSGEHDDDYQSTIGENVLESFSLSANAIWKLNSLYKLVKDENIPQGDYDGDGLVEMLKGELNGAEFLIDVQNHNVIPNASEVKSWVPKPKKSRKRRK